MVFLGLLKFQRDNLRAIAGGLDVSNKPSMAMAIGPMLAKGGMGCMPQRKSLKVKAEK